MGRRPFPLKPISNPFVLPFGFRFLLAPSGRPTIPSILQVRLSTGMDRQHMMLILLLLQALTIALKLLDEVNSIIDDDEESNNKLELAEDGCEEEHQKSLSAMLFLSMFFDECRLPRGTLTGIRYGKWYIRPRSNHWWLHFEDYVMIVDAARFKEIFRVSQETFHYICEMVEPDLEVRTPPSFSSIPNRVLSVQKQVAIALKRLATGESFLTLSEFFGVGTSTAARITLKFVEALLKNGQRHLQWPTGADMLAVKRGFQEKHGFPNCCGAIDATHIIMELPEYENEVDWFDRETNFSMLVQAIVDSRTKFLDVVAGYPGSVNDARQLRVSNFAQLVQREERLNGPSVQVSNQSIREYIIGDAGYPLLPWLIVPFPGLNLPPKTDRYNYMHSSTRMAVERAFGLLKKSWQLLNRKIYKPNKRSLSRIIIACCMLHNIMIDRGDRYSTAVFESLENFEHAAPYEDEPIGREPQNTGHQLRQALCDYLWTRR